MRLKWIRRAERLLLILAAAMAGYYMPWWAAITNILVVMGVSILADLNVRIPLQQMIKWRDDLSALAASNDLQDLVRSDFAANLTQQEGQHDQKEKADVAQRHQNQTPEGRG